MATKTANNTKHTTPRHWFGSCSSKSGSGCWKSNRWPTRSIVAKQLILLFQATIIIYLFIKWAEISWNLWNFLQVLINKVIDRMCNFVCVIQRLNHVKPNFWLMCISLCFAKTCLSWKDICLFQKNNWHDENFLEILFSSCWGIMEFQTRIHLFFIVKTSKFQRKLRKVLINDEHSLHVTLVRIYSAIACNTTSLNLLIDSKFWTRF